MDNEGSWEKVAEYQVSRPKVLYVALPLGMLLGYLSSFLDVDFTPRLAVFGWAAAAIGIVIVLHEGVHGLAAAALGVRPVFGIKPPLIFTTFREKIRRGHMIVIALAPLILLDALFVALYLQGVLPLLSDLCFMVNTLGALGDVWIVLKLLPQERGTWVQDTMSGVEVWRTTGA